MFQVEKEFMFKAFQCSWSIGFCIFRIATAGATRCYMRHGIIVNKYIYINLKDTLYSILSMCLNTSNYLCVSRRVCGCEATRWHHHQQQHLERHHHNQSARCVIGAGLVYHTVLPQLARAQAAQYKSSGPKLWHKMRHSFGLGVSYSVEWALASSGSTVWYTRPETMTQLAS